MSVVKIIEMVGESSKDWQDAVAKAVSEASRTVSNISGVEVANMTAQVNDGRITGYRANVKVACSGENNH